MSNDARAKDCENAAQAGRRGGMARAASRAACVLAAMLMAAAMLACAGCASGGGGGGGAGTGAGQSSASAAMASSAASASSAAMAVNDTMMSSSAASASSASAAASAKKGDPALAARLNEALNPIVQAAPLDVNVAVIDLKTGTKAGVDGDEKMYSASMIKLAIAYTFLEKAKAGAFNLDATYALQGSDIVGGTGVIGGYGAGAEITYRELLDTMISNSDNTSANILINAVGMDAVNATAKKLGLKATELNRLMMDTDAIAAGVENYTSANDVAVLLEMVYDGKFVDADSSFIMLKALEGQQDFGGVQEGLPPNVAFAHKTGTLSTVRHDGGIVEADAPFVLVVLCGGEGFSEQGAHAAMAQVAATVYDIIR